MKRRDFLSLTACTAAALTGAPGLSTPRIDPAGQRPGVPLRPNLRGDDFVVSGESFFEGHADKLADLIADTVTDTLQGLRVGRGHGGAIDVFASRDLIVIGGTVAGPWGPMIECIDDSFWDRYEAPVRQLLRETGHHQNPFGVDPQAVEIRFSSIVQCFDIALDALGEPGPDEPVRLYGYATDETPELMPLPTLLAQRLSARAAEVRRSGVLPWLLPHGRVRVSVLYASGVPVAVDSVELIAQHRPEIYTNHFREEIVDKVLVPVIPEHLISRQTKLLLNPTGPCVIGGLAIKCGISGGSLASDTYGAYCPLPSARLAGQGTLNIERSGTLMARHLAKHIVAADLARRCTVHLAYRTGEAEPEAVLVDTHGTGTLPEERIERGIRAVFPLTPWAVFEYLDLGRPIYRNAAAFGYFGRQEPALTWERTDKVSELMAAV